MVCTCCVSSHLWTGLSPPISSGARCEFCDCTPFAGVQKSAIYTAVTKAQPKTSKQHFSLWHVHTLIRLQADKFLLLDQCPTPVCSPPCHRVPTCFAVSRGRPRHALRLATRPALNVAHLGDSVRHHERENMHARACLDTAQACTSNSGLHLSTFQSSKAARFYEARLSGSCST